MKKLVSLVLAIAMLCTMFVTASAEEKSITIAVQSHSSLEALSQYYDEFTAATGIKVIIDQSPQDQLSQKILMDLSSGTGAFDIIGIHEIWLGQYADSGWLAPLDEYIAKETETNPDFDFADFASPEAFQYNGIQYGLPLYNEVHMLFYNKEIFAEAGLPDRAPTSWSELEEFAKTIKEKTGKAGVAMRGISDNRAIIYTWNIFAYSNGWEGWFVDGKANFNNPKAVEAATFYCDLLNNYGPEGIGSYNWTEVQTLMQQGGVGMVIDASNFGARLENPEASTITGKIGYGTVPTADKTGEAKPGILSYGMYIPSASQHKDEAWQFLVWALSKETQLKTALNGVREDVTRKSVINQPEYIAKYDVGNYLEMKAASMGIGCKHYPCIVPFEEVSHEVSVALNTLLTQKVDATALFETLNAKIDSIMAEE